MSFFSVNIKHHNLRNAALVVLLTFFIPAAYGQSFADKEYYLVDSLILEDLSIREKHLVDSTLSLFHLAKHDTDKINALSIVIEESWDDNVWPRYNNWMYNYVKSKLANQPLSYNPEKDSSSKLFLLKSLADALNNKGLNTFDRGNYSEALVLYSKSLKVSKDIEYQLGIAASYHNIAFLHQNQGDIHKALENYFKSLKITEEIGNKKVVASALNNIGIVYRNQGDRSKALEFYHKSLKVSEETNDSMAIAHSINNIALVHTEKKEYAESLKYYQKSLTIWEAYGFKKGIAHSLNRIGNITKIQGDIDGALDYYFRSLAIWEEIGNKKGITQSLASIGSIYFDQNQFLKAKKYGLRSMKVAEETGFPFSISGASKLLSQIYQKEGKWDKAFKMQNLYITMRDSMRNQETEKDAILQEANYEMDKKEQEILLLSTQNKVLEKDKEVRELKLNENRLLIISFSVAFGFVLILVVAMLRGYKKKQLINELLEKQKEHFRIQNQEKIEMMKEIHHRVKNNLQIVSSLLRLQSSEIDDERITAMFEETQNRVLSMAHLHEKLYQSEDLKHVDIQEHFTLLINELVRDYEVGVNIDLDINIEHVDLGIKTLIPLGLIINELITNSLKYAFKEKKKGLIIIQLKQLDEVKYELLIGDNGVGMDKDFNVKEASSLGTQLVQIFVEQLDGTIARLDQPGTLFRIVFERIDKVL